MPYALGRRTGLPDLGGQPLRIPASPSHPKTIQMYLWVWYHPTHPHTRWACGWRLVSDYEDFQRENYAGGQGYEGPPVPLGWSGPRTTAPSALPLGTFPALEFAAYSQLPAVRALPPLRDDEDEAIDEANGGVPLPSDAWFEPGYQPYRTVFERAPGGIYETNRAPTDWDRVYDEYVVLNAPEAPEAIEEVPVLHGSIDWGNVVGTIVGGAADPFGAGRYAASLFNNPIPPVNPLTGTGAPATGVRIDPRTGRPVCKRRRRRRLLTDGDFNDLMRISTLPNKDIVKIALAKAVGR